MAKKEVFRKFSNILIWMGGCSGLLNILFGKPNIFIIICSSICFLAMFLDIVAFVKKEVTLYLFYRALNKLYDDLKSLHKIRYKCYFSEQTEEIDYITQKIEESYKQAKETTESLFKYYQVTGKIKNNIQEIVNKMKKLTETIQPE